MEELPHRDRETGTQIRPATVAVQFVQVDPIPGDTAGRIDMALSESSGPLLVFSNGIVREGTWQKGLVFAPTAWLDGNGQPMAIPPGQVWIEVVPLTARVSY
jgi:hypothetical protein